MNLNWLRDNTIFLTLHGSQAYGLANELSDVDVKGICIPPREVESDLFYRFEQRENDSTIEEKYAKWKNPHNPKFESVVYSLRKFFLLAAKVNPNVIELLWTSPETWLEQSKWSEILLDKRDMFLSTRANFTFTGYAIAQAKKIERHRKWIIQGELQPPKRSDFGLSETISRGTEEIFNYIKARVEQWNLNQFPLEEDLRSDLKETIWELVYEVSKVRVDWDNWADVYSEASLNSMAKDLDLNEKVVKLINSERLYYKSKKNYESWLRWKAERNPARRALEVKCGYDSKHASHLVRLMRMGYEILDQGKVLVKRPDAEELLAIKNGHWTFDQVMEFSESMQKRLKEKYAQVESDRKSGKQCKLPKEVNYTALNDFYHKLSEEYYLNSGK